MQLCFVDCEGLCAIAQAVTPAGGPIAGAEAVRLEYVSIARSCVPAGGRITVVGTPE